jgi:hypothetical protein
MLLQTTLIQYITSVPNLIGLVIELGGVYLYFRESIFKLNEKCKVLENEISNLKNLSIKVIALESKMDIINNNQEHLIKDFEKMEKSLDTITFDVHKMKGTLITIEGYFKQVLERDK